MRLKILRLNFETTWKFTSIILVFAAAETVRGLITLQSGVMLVFSLFLAGTLEQQVQQNYGVTHFNQCWGALSVLAAKACADAFSVSLIWPVHAALAAFCLYCAYPLVRSIIHAYSRQSREILAHGDNHFALAYSWARTIGTYIRRQAKPDDRLFVWGDFPSVYLYAGLVCPLGNRFFFPYSHYGRLWCEKELIAGLKEAAPEWLLFFNYKVNDGWNADRVRQAIGIAYNPVKAFAIRDSLGRVLPGCNGTRCEFALYRRDDTSYCVALLKRGSTAVNDQKPEVEAQAVGGMVSDGGEKADACMGGSIRVLGLAAKSFE